MNAIYALAAHALGDFPLQTDRMATQKFDNRAVRAKHVLVYTAAYAPAVYATDWDRQSIGVFVGVLASSHYVIDSRRWNDAVPIWYDQALHIIALAVAVALANAVGEGRQEVSG